MLGPGCLNFALALSLASWPALLDVEGSFARILHTIAVALDLPSLAVAGRTDLALDARKVSGNAQRRGRQALLHHGTLLYDFDAGLATRYLREPARQPAYRSGRRHQDFIGNLPLSGGAVRVRLEAACRSLEAGRFGPGLRPDGTPSRPRREGTMPSSNWRSRHSSSH